MSLSNENRKLPNTILSTGNQYANLSTDVTIEFGLRVDDLVAGKVFSSFEGLQKKIEVD